MNRKQKIIVSVVGITIVMLALLGITYAYYLTRIQGNTNTNSISITTADLKLVYADGNGFIEATGVMPGDSITKTFTVENTGENKVNGYTIVLENVVNELSRREDLTYDLICTLDDGTSCGKTEDNLYPKTSNISIIYANDIDKDVKHNYELIIKYIYLDDIDQSDDMGSVISGKVNIYDAKDDKLNPYKTGVTATDNKNLAYNIIENARLEKNGTSLTGTPLSSIVTEPSMYSYGKNLHTTFPLVNSVSTSSNLYTYADDFSIDSDGLFSLIEPKTLIYSEGYENLKGKYIVSLTGALEEESSSNVSTLYRVSTSDVDSDSFSYISVNKYVSNESVLSITQDDYGTSYYFRGGVQDNFLTFAGMCWRVIRIQGDGSIKLILEDQDEVCSSEINGNWNIFISDGNSRNTGYYGTSSYDVGELLASDGVTTNTEGKYIIDYLKGKNNSISIATAFKNFQTQKLSEYLNKMKAGDWCLDNVPHSRTTAKPYVYTPLTEEEFLDKTISGKSIYYSKRTSVSDYSFKCSTTFSDFFGDDVTPMYVASLNIDEIIYSGAASGKENYSYYLMNDYQRTKNLYWWTISPNAFSSNYGAAFVVYPTGSLVSRNVYYQFSFRPSIILKAGTIISSGEGTQSNPYVVE